jgi:hypothetical protein
MPIDACLNITIGGTVRETICAQACRNNADCPRAYECSLNNFCYPIPGSIRPHTCASLADMLAGRTCDPLGMTDQCGLTNYDDGTCFPLLGCTVGCSSNTECPVGSTCTSYVVASYCAPD